MVTTQHFIIDFDIENILRIANLFVKVNPDFQGNVALALANHSVNFMIFDICNKLDELTTKKARRKK